MSAPQCPLTGSTEVEIKSSFKATELVELYNWKRKLDVSKELPSEEIKLCHNPAVDFYFFQPMCDGSAKFYADLTSKPLYSVEKQEYKFAAQHVQDGQRLLDVGCGWGYWAPYVKHSQYHGLELSESAVKTCQEKGLAVEARLVQDVVAEQPESFDVVASFQVLEHLADPLDFFANCLRCVKPGGKLIISVPNADSFMLDRENNYLNYPPHHVSWWTLKTMEYLAEKFHLSIVSHFADEAVGNELAMHNAAIIQKWFNNLSGRKYRPIRNGLMDRAMLKGFDGTGKVIAKFKGLGEKPANGHSITIVFKK